MSSASILSNKKTAVCLAVSFVYFILISILSFGTSIVTLVSLDISPETIIITSGSSSSVWIIRLSGRAPYLGSNPFLANYF